MDFYGLLFTNVLTLCSVFQGLFVCLWLKVQALPYQEHIIVSKVSIRVEHAWFIMSSLFRCHFISNEHLIRFAFTLSSWYLFISDGYFVGLRLSSLHWLHRTNYKTLARTKGTYLFSNESYLFRNFGNTPKGWIFLSFMPDKSIAATSFYIFYCCSLCM